MVKVIWPESYDEYDQYAYAAHNEKLKIIDVNRHPFFPSRKTGEYDIHTGRGYVGFMVEKNGNHYYYLLDFGKIKARIYENGHSENCDIIKHIPIGESVQEFVQKKVSCNRSDIIDLDE